MRERAWGMEMEGVVPDESGNATSVMRRGFSGGDLAAASAVAVAAAA